MILIKDAHIKISEFFNTLSQKRVYNSFFRDDIESSTSNNTIYALAKQDYFSTGICKPMKENPPENFIIPSLVGVA